MPAAKLPALRLLESRRIPHRVVEFDPAIRSAAEVAREAGVPPARVLKTLVLEVEPPGRRPLLLMMRADAEVDLKALAAALGVKRARMARHGDAERLTGLQVGGISALALAGRGFPVLIDSGALDQETVLVSAGARGVDVELAPADVVALTGARAVAVPSVSSPE